VPEQQITTLKEVLPHLRAGGVYLCEDVSWIHHRFAAFVAGLAGSLNVWTGEAGYTTGFQSQIHSVHSYPFVTVIEKCERAVDRLIPERRGTEWQPFTPWSSPKRLATLSASDRSSRKRARPD
jgi:hypothetical protein